MINVIIWVVSLAVTALVSIFNIDSWAKCWIVPVSFIASFLACILLTFAVLFVLTLGIDKTREYDKKSNFYHNLFVATLHCICTFSRVKVVVEGKEKLPKGERFMIVSNHRSRYDPMIACYVLKDYDLSCVSKPSNFKIFIGGKLMARDGFIPINRQNNREGLKAIERAERQIYENNHSVYVCPEGMRNLYNNNLLPFRNGCFKIAQRTNSKIVITTFDGTEKIKKNAPWHSTKVVFRIVDVIDAKDFENTNQIADYVREKMEMSLYGEIR